MPNHAMDSPPEAPVTVSLLAVQQTSAAVLYGLFEVFAAVGVAWEEITGEGTGARRMAPRIIARDRETIVSPIGAPIVPHSTLAETLDSDVVVVPDLHVDLDLETGEAWRVEAEWIAGRYEAGATVCSVCTGSLLLAEAGILDGKEATTHWSAVEIFRRLYPAVRLRPERILCPDGAEHRVITSGGSASWEDLALYLIARRCGEAEAMRVAKVFVMGDRSDGQLVFTALGRPRGHDDRIIGDCQTWIAQNYAAPNPVARMVARSGLSERTFKRRFKIATGYAPVDYVQAVRVEEAKQLLETTAESPDAIAAAIGYEDPTFFRRLFKRRTGVTPSRYRQRFRAIGRTRQ